MEKVTVINRSHGSCSYTIKDGGYHIYREFMPGERKEISRNELEQLSYKPGGKVLLEEYLHVIDKETIDDLGLHTEPEYDMTEEDIINALSTAPMDEFLDILDFAPEGVKELIKIYSVTLPLNDVAKRDAIYEKLHFNVTTAIENAKSDEVSVPAAPAARTRRVKKEGEAETAVEAPRRTYYTPISK